MYQPLVLVFIYILPGVSQFTDDIDNFFVYSGDGEHALNT